MTLGGLGFTGAIYQARFGTTGTALTLPTLSSVPIPLLSDIPIIGSALFNQAPTTYFTYLLAPALWYFVYRTEWGLELRAVGEEPDAAAAAGITAVIQPGGSMRDDEIIAAADEANIAMVFTGIRHFRH